jgi:hypothetical protein
MYVQVVQDNANFWFNLSSGFRLGWYPRHDVRHLFLSFELKAWWNKGNTVTFAPADYGLGRWGDYIEKKSFG